MMFNDVPSFKLDNFMNEILDVFYDGIYITDADGVTLNVNTAYEKLTGLKKEDLLGRRVTDLEIEGVFQTPLNSLIVKTGRSQTNVWIRTIEQSTNNSLFALKILPKVACRVLC